MAATVSVNGVIFDQDHAVISVFDHGFLFGEGVYETLRTYNARPFLFGRHMRRLRTSAGMIDLSIPLSDEDMARRCAQTLHAAGLDAARDAFPSGGGSRDEAYIRILVTRGIGDLTYDAECTTFNLFVVTGGEVLTPPLQSGLLAGITRELVFELGPWTGVTVREAVLKDEDLLGADEAFLTSTTREVLPIVKVDDRPVGTGQPGPVTRRLLEAYRAAAATDLH